MAKPAKKLSTPSKLPVKISVTNPSTQRAVAMRPLRANNKSKGATSHCAK